MIELWKKIDVKTLSTLATNIGGFIVALFLGYIIFDLTTNQITTVKAEVTSLRTDFNTGNTAFIDALSKNTQAFNANTAAFQQQSQLLQQFLINLKR